jgi:uncharacterized protein (DUF1684 family)
MSALVASTLILAAVSLPAPPTLAELEAQTRAWHERRMKALTADDGWLTLVGLQWLQEGPNQLQLPPPGPSPAGTLTRRKDEASLQPAPGAQFRLGPARFAGGALKNDAKGEPDVLTVDRLKLHVIKRGERLGVRIKDPEAPARKQFKGIERFPVSADYRVVARFEPSPSPRKLAVPTVLGTVDEMAVPGTAVFELKGKPLRLTAVLEDGEDELFFIFADETNKSDTYGAGRFLYAKMPEDGKVVLDFNRAYNPPCAFSHFATCPLPPKENRLPLRIEAGEKRYGDH